MTVFAKLSARVRKTFRPEAPRSTTKLVTIHKAPQDAHSLGLAALPKPERERYARTEENVAQVQNG